MFSITKNIHLQGGQQTEALVYPVLVRGQNGEQHVLPWISAVSAGQEEVLMIGMQLVIELAKQTPQV